tara:strand:- start:337 stop:1581 length:1245 start_codon:yes stop_codon:yes gene_type:complete
MNIFYFHQYFTTRSGSFGTRSYELAKELVSRGHCVTIVCIANDRSNSGLKGAFRNNLREGIVEGIKVIEFNFFYSNKLNIFERTKIFIKYVFKTLSLIYKQDIDLIYASSTPLTIGISAIFGKIFKGIPYIFEVRDLWPELLKEMGVIRNPIIIWILSLLEITSYAFSNNCVGLSKGICDGINKKNFMNRKIYLSPNACDLDLFKSQEINRKDPSYLNKYGLNFTKNDFVVAFTGAHGVANGLDFLLDVGQSLLNMKRSDIKILFIGDGSCKEKLISRKNLQNINNCFFIDPISKLELSEVFNNSIKVGLMILEDIPAFYNGTSPNKFFDYIASSLPVLCNYPGWISNLITKNQIGFSIKPNFCDDFASKLVLLADNPNLLSSMSIKARKLGERNFSRKQINNQLIKIIENFDS